MNCIEFIEVMNVLGINNVLDKSKGYKNKIIFFKETEFRDVYEWYGLEIYYPGRQACVCGNFPKSFLDYMNTKYSDKYHFSENCSRKNFYNKEDLLLFLLEYKNYIFIQKGEKEAEVTNYDELLNKVNIKILENVDTNISAERIINNINPNNKYKESRKVFSDSVLGKEFIDLINRFDNLVNCLSDEKVNIIKVLEFMKKYKIEAVVNDDLSCNILMKFISDNSTYINIKYRRYNTGFNIFYSFKNEDKSFSIEHCYWYTNYEDIDSKNKEEEKIYLSTSNGIEIKYNILENKTIYNSNLSVNDFINLYDYLSLAVNYGEETIKNNLLFNIDSKKLIMK